MAPSLVYLGNDQVQHSEQPSTLITKGQCQTIHSTNTNYWCQSPKTDQHRLDLREKKKSTEIGKKEKSTEAWKEYSGQRWEGLDGCVTLNYKIEFQVKGWERGIRWHNLGTTTKLVAMVWACAAKRRESVPKLFFWKNIVNRGCYVYQYAWDWLCCYCPHLFDEYATGRSSRRSWHVIVGQYLVTCYWPSHWTVTRYVV